VISSDNNPHPKKIHDDAVKTIYVDGDFPLELYEKFKEAMEKNCLSFSKVEDKQRCDFILIYPISIRTDELVDPKFRNSTAPYIFIRETPTKNKYSNKTVLQAISASRKSFDLRLRNDKNDFEENDSFKEVKSLLEFKRGIFVKWFK